MSEEPRDDSALVSIAGMLLQSAEATQDPRIAKLAATAVEYVTSSGAIIVLLKELADLKSKNNNPFTQRVAKTGDNNAQIQSLIKQIAEKVQQ